MSNSTGEVSLLKAGEIVCQNGLLRTLIDMGYQDQDNKYKYCTSWGPYSHIPRELFRFFPGLGRQSCGNDRGNTSFRREASDTELPHLLEHFVIELQALACYHKLLLGQTSWNWEPGSAHCRGVFVVEISYERESLARAALAESVTIINTLIVNPSAVIDGEGILDKLRLVKSTHTRRVPPKNRILGLQMFLEKNQVMTSDSWQSILRDAREELAELQAQI